MHGEASREDDKFVIYNCLEEAENMVSEKFKEYWDYISENKCDILTGLREMIKSINRENDSIGDVVHIGVMSNEGFKCIA